MKKWSKYQEAVFDFILNEPGNAIVNATAGSGKTSTIEEAVGRVPMESSVLAIAFTCQIRDELKKRLGHLFNVTVYNLNGFGNSCIPGFKKLNKWKVSNLLKYTIYDLGDNYDKERFKEFSTVVGPATKLISLAKGHMIFTLSDFTANWEHLADEYDVTLPDDIDIKPILFTLFDLDQKAKIIDFDDQIALPLRLGYPIKKFDYVFVDESQDLTPAQIELTRRAGGRLIYVGDVNQSIMLFRGADSNAMGNIQRMTNATALPLSICYRCSKAVVRKAQKLFPEIEFHEDAPEGEENDIDLNEFRIRCVPGDLVVCRTTAPLISECLRFIRGGYKALVKGREIGANLREIVTSLSEGEDIPVDAFLERLRRYDQEQMEKLKNKEEKLISHSDRVETIAAMCADVENVSEVLKRFDSIFGDEAEADAINLMTVHKAKGLEATNVFILFPDLMPHKLAKSAEALVQERNISFVAITRAKFAINSVWKNESNNEN